MILQLFDCYIQVHIEERLLLIAVLYNPEIRERTTHLLTFWMKHMFTQMESEFTPKLLRFDTPKYEFSDPQRFLYYQELFGLYSRLSLTQMTKSFGEYVRKLL